METYLDGTGYNNYGNQYPEVGYWILRGDTKLLVSQLDTEKNFRPCSIAMFCAQICSSLILITGLSLTLLFTKHEEIST